jgi:hypothetical protein
MNANAHTKRPYLDREVYDGAIDLAAELGFVCAYGDAHGSPSLQGLLLAVSQLPPEELNELLEQHGATPEALGYSVY